MLSVSVGLATVWTVAVWAVVQELGRRHAAAAAPQPAAPGLPGAARPPGPAAAAAAGQTPGIRWPAVICACPVAHGDAGDGMATLGDVSLGYLGPLRWVFLASADDPEAVTRAQRHAHRVVEGGGTAQAVATRPFGRNRKAAQLAQLPEAAAAAPAGTVDVFNAIATAKGGAAPDAAQTEGVTLILDSDVAPDSVDVTALVSCLMGEGCRAAAWQPTAPGAADTCLGDRLATAVLAGGAHAIALLALLDGRSPVGKVLAYRTQAVAQAGGWGAVVDAMGEDVAMGARLRQRGHDVVALGGAPARTVRRGQRAREVTRRFGRWLYVVRSQRPGLLVSYPSYLFFLPPLLALWAWAGVAGAPRPWVAAGAALAVVTRWKLGGLARRSCGSASPPLQRLGDIVLGDIVLGDGTLLLVFCTALLRRKIWWNGRQVAA